MSTPTVRKAVIPVAGLGTRFLPATKAVPKEMLPIVDKPVIQFVVEEAVRAGIRDILFITGRGKRPIEDHFDRAPDLEQHLEANGKLELLDELRASNEMADIHSIRQAEPLGLGHAVSLARHHVGDEPFAVLLGDDIIVESTPLLQDMLAVHQRHGASVLAVLEVPLEEISAYGSARSEKVEDGVVRILDVVEKPKPEDAPSNLAVIGRYVFTPAIFDALDRVKPGAGNEIQLTDAIGLLLAEEPVYGRVFEQGRYDAGDKFDYLRATVELALERKDLGPRFRAYLTELVGGWDPS